MLISCVIATERRPQFISRAVALFNAQTYEEKQLVIVDDFEEPSVRVPLELGRDVVYLRCPGFSQGRKLDVGMRCADGVLLAKWDDDDLYLSDFLKSAIARHQAGAVTCLRKSLIQTCDGVVRVRDNKLLSGGSIVMDRDVFRAIGCVSDVRRNVDGDLFMRCVQNGVKINRQAEYFDEYVYVRHGTNTWNDGMQSRMREDGRMEHRSLDEVWKEYPVYEGAKRAEVAKWLQ